MGIALQPQTRQALNHYFKQVATLNNVESVVERFAVAPQPEQRIIAAYQQSADFLKQINILTVANAQGEKLGLNVGTIASTTNTTVTVREPVYPGELELIDEYLCTQTNYDVAMRYALLDAWAHNPDFQQKLAGMIVRAIALDKLMIGFNGISRAATSNRSTNPLLQDVNKGWLQKIREFAPERVFAGEIVAPATDKKLMVGASHEFKTLDGLVETAIEDLIADQYKDSGLIAICGRGILSDKYLPIINTVQDATNQIAARNIYANKQLGTLQAVHVPNFPAKKILITNPKNLSIYIQTGSIRRLIANEAPRDRYVDYQSANESFVVENYEGAALLENIEFD